MLIFSLSIINSNTNDISIEKNIDEKILKRDSSKEKSILKQNTVNKERGDNSSLKTGVRNENTTSKRKSTQEVREDVVKKDVKKKSTYNIKNNIKRKKQTQDKQTQEQKEEFISYIASVNDKYITAYSIERYQKLTKILGINVDYKTALEQLIEQYICFENTIAQGVDINKAQLNYAIEVFASSNKITVEKISNMMNNAGIYDVFIDYVKSHLIKNSISMQTILINDNDYKLFGINKKNGELLPYASIYKVGDDIDELYLSDYGDLIKANKQRDLIEDIKNRWRDNVHIVIK